MKTSFLIILIVLMFPMSSYAGWEKDETGTRYYTESGTYKTGWHNDVDGKWYYLDDKTGYVLINTKTPDGFIVDEFGVWKEIRGNINVAENYNKSIQFQVSGCEGMKDSVMQFGNSVPVTIYYNEDYVYMFNKKVPLDVKISQFELSKDGIVYMHHTVSEETYYYNFDVITRYFLETGEVEDVVSKVGGVLRFGQEDKNIKSSLMSMLPGKNRPKIVSAEVYINIGTDD